MSADRERVLRRRTETRRSTWLFARGSMRWCGGCGRRQRSTRSAGAVGGWMLRAWEVSFDGGACVGVSMVLSVFPLSEPLASGNLTENRVHCAFQGSCIRGLMHIRWWGMQSNLWKWSLQVQQDAAPIAWLWAGWPAAARRICVRAHR